MNTDLTVAEMTDILYPHYLKNEINRRNEAIDLLKSKKFSELKRNYVHYYSSVVHFQEFEDLSITSVMVELQNFKTPENSSKPFLDFQLEIEDVEDSKKIGISWMEYYIADVDKCASLAKCWTSDTAWKIKHQPNGKDGINGLKLLNSLMK